MCEKSPRVTLVTPTYGREPWLRLAYRLFSRQTYSDLEWLICDDSPQPSSFMASLIDPRVRYHYSHDRAPLGAKRDWLVRHSSGAVIVNFDDDDYYSPHYVARMVDALQGCDLVKLVNWFIVDTRSSVLYYWNTSDISLTHFSLGRERSELTPVSVLGVDPLYWAQHPLSYGFSCAFRREVYDIVHYDVSRNGSEDLAFVNGCIQASLRLRGLSDQDGVAVHLIHPQVSSQSFPNFILPHFILERLDGGRVVDHLRLVAEMIKTQGAGGPSVFY